MFARILHPREIQALWSQNGDAEMLALLYPWGTSHNNGLFWLPSNAASIGLEFESYTVVFFLNLFANRKKDQLTAESAY